MEKQKVIFVTPWYDGFAGGYEFSIRRYAEFLALSHIDVEVLTTCCKSPYDPWDVDHHNPGTSDINNVVVRRFKTNKGQLQRHLVARTHNGNQPVPLEKQYDFFTFGISSNDLIQYVSSIPKDIPIICGPYFHSLCFNLLTSHPQRIILQPAFHDEQQMHWQPVKDMIAHAKDFIFFTEEEKDLAILANIGTSNKRLVEAQVIGCPLNEYDYIFQSNPTTPAALPKHYFLYVGRKEIGKNVGLLINWYTHYLSKNPTAPALVFVGGGDDMLATNTNPGLIDLGYIDETQKNSIIKNAIALINLSNNESFSYVIMEAWLNRTPIIASSDCAVTRSHCIKSHGGLLASNESSFTAALETMQNQSINEELANNGFNYVMTHYSITHVINQFLDTIAL